MRGPCRTLRSWLNHKVDALQAVIDDPDGNFKFANPTPDWLSHDGRLVARLY